MRGQIQQLISGFNLSNWKEANQVDGKKEPEHFLVGDNTVR